MSSELFEEYVGRKIGGCRVARRIGGGGMGVVFEARHLALAKRVALKLLLPGLAADDTFVKRFVSEARMAAQVEHPNVVQVLNVGRDGNVYFMVMQFIEGHSLRELMGRGPVPPAEAARIGLEAARGLGAAHAKGIIHRDVKPENILIDRDGVARVVDMGLSKSLSTSESAMLTAPGTAMGTPNYISPEQATEARAADARSDVYSLGATLYHALTGSPPFEGPSAIAVITKHIRDALPPLAERNPEVPPALAAVVERMMAKAPEDRYQTMGQVVEALEPFTGASRSAAPAASAPGAEGRTVPTARLGVPAAARAGTSRRWPFVVLGAVGTLGVILFLGFLAAAGNPGRKALRSAQHYEASHPRDYAGSRERYEAVRGQFPGTQWDARAAAAIGELDSRLAADSRQEFEALRSRAQPLEEARRWEDAARIWAGCPAEFAGTDAGRAAAARAAEARGQAALAGLLARAKPLLEKHDWRAAEPIMAEFPADLAGTDAGRRAAVLRQRAHIGGRAQKLVDALIAGNLDEAGKYFDPSKEPGGIRLFVGVAHVLIKLSRDVTYEVKDVQMEAPGRAVVPVQLHVRFKGTRPDEHPMNIQVWQQIGEGWFIVGDKKPAEGRPDPPERPLRPKPPEGRRDGQQR